MKDDRFKLTIYLVLTLTDLLSSSHIQYLWWFPDKSPSVIESDPPVPARPCSLLPLSVLVAAGAPVWKNFRIRKERADRQLRLCSSLADGLGFFLLYLLGEVVALALVISKRDFGGFSLPSAGIAAGRNVGMESGLLFLEVFSLLDVCWGEPELL